MDERIRQICRCMDELDWIRHVIASGNGEDTVPVSWMLRSVSWIG